MSYLLIGAYEARTPGGAAGRTAARRVSTLVRTQDGRLHALSAEQGTPEALASLCAIRERRGARSSGARTYVFPAIHVGGRR